MSTNVASDFVAYPKTPRLFRDIVITEKLDGTNSQIVIELASDAQNGGHLSGSFYMGPEGGFIVRAGSRNRWVTPSDDNYGFAKWVSANRAELIKLGPGRHFGEWWGGGIQRGYGLKGDDKRFSLFNVARWADGALKPVFVPGSHIQIGEEPQSPRPACCGVVPVLYRGLLCTETIKQVITNFRTTGSHAVPGWMKPEGLIVFHTAANRAFKVLLENDGEAKGAE